jgi:hypothetical protein
MTNPQKIEGGKKNAIRLFCSCGWQELVPVDASLTKEEAYKSCNKVQVDHMKTHDKKFSLESYKMKHVGSSKKLIN